MNSFFLNLKKSAFVAIPISLVFSIYVNSIVIIIFLALFLPGIYKNFKEYNTATNRKLFLVFTSFIAVYLIGATVDLFYGDVNFKKAERLLSFIIFPSVLLFSDALRIFRDKKTPLKIFSFFVVLFNCYLICNLLNSAFENYKDDSLTNERWRKSNVEIKEVIEDSSQMFSVNEIIANESTTRPDLILERSISLKSDTSITRSIYIKSNDDIWVLLRQFDKKTHKGAWFYPKSAALGFVQNGVKANIDSLGDGWCRISLTNLVSSETGRERLQLTFVDKDKSYSKTIGKKFRLLTGGAQIEIANTASKYEPLKHRSFFENFDRTKILNLVEGHPTYYSLYILLSSLSIILFIRKWYIQALCLAVNIPTVIFLGSKAVILTLFIVFLALLFLNWKAKKSQAIVLLLILPLTLLGVFVFSNTVHRFNQSLNSLTNSKETVYLSTDKRIIMWKSVFDLPLTSLIVGNGNIHGYEKLRERTGLNLNTHNQYLEALLCAGLLGLLLLIVLLGGLFFVDFSARKNQLLILFIIMIGINIFFENLLNRQWGIVFVTFFMSYIYKLGPVNE